MRRRRWPKRMLVQQRRRFYLWQSCLISVLYLWREHHRCTCCRVGIRTWRCRPFKICFKVENKGQRGPHAQPSQEGSWNWRARSWGSSWGTQKRKSQHSRQLSRWGYQGTNLKACQGFFLTLQCLALSTRIGIPISGWHRACSTFCSCSSWVHYLNRSIGVSCPLSYLIGSSSYIRQSPHLRIRTQNRVGAPEKYHLVPNSCKNLLGLRRVYW